MMKMILLSLSGHKFSSSVEKIRHILAGPEIFPMVCLRRGIRGTILYAGETIPIIDPMEFMDLDQQTIEAVGGYLVVFQSDYGDIGLPVDSEMTIVDAEDGSFEGDVSEETNASDSQVFCFKGARYPLLDLNEILAQITD